MVDGRIRDIAGLIDSGRYQLLSLDLFDTVVYRTVPTPKDVFFLLARELQSRNWMHPTSSPESFHKERIGAEERARKRKPSFEVTLDQIYAEFPRGYLSGATPAQAAAAEFEIESRLVKVNPEMRDLIERARAKGLLTAFVSDSYFSSDQLRSLVGIEVDHLLVSCEEGIGKYLGLHGRLIERAGIEPARMLHVGNDYKADVEGPSAFNMERYWFRQWPDEYEELAAMELPATSSGRAALLTGPNAGLETVRGRAMFSAEGPYRTWGAGVLGPVVAGYCDWVAERCVDLEISTVLCLMREGDIFKDLIDRSGAELDTRTFYISRYSARKAAIFEATEQELKGFVFRPSAQRRGKLLDQLGLTPRDLGGADPDELLGPEATMDFIRRVHRDPALRAKVVRESGRARAGLMAHLRSVLPDQASGRVAVVDLGYKGTIQECLQRILDHEGLSLQTHGLYMVTGGEVHQTQATGAAVEGWLAENGQPVAMAHTFMRSPEIVEQSLMASCGTTLGHEADGTPILDIFRAPEEQRTQITEIQDGLRIYADAWREHRAALGLSAGDLASLRPLYQAICIRSVARPLPVELELFGQWRHDENFGTENTRGLAEVEEMDEWEQGHISAHQLASLPMSRLYWPFGFARRISPTMGEAVTNIFLRTAEPEVFESGHQEQFMVVYLDTGEGFNAKEATIRPYRLNNRGRVWTRFTLDLRGGRPGPRQLAFSIGLKDQVMNFTGVRVHERNQGSTEVVTRIPHEEVGKAGYRHLGKNLYLVDDDPALLVLPLEQSAAGTTSIDIDLFFGLVLGG